MTSRTYTPAALSVRSFECTGDSDFTDFKWSITRFCDILCPINGIMNCRHCSWLLGCQGGEVSCDERNLQANLSEGRLIWRSREWVCGFWCPGLWEAVWLHIAEWKLCPGVTAKTHQKPHIRAGSVLSVLPVELGRLHFIHHLFPSGGISQRTALE